MSDDRIPPKIPPVIGGSLPISGRRQTGRAAPRRVWVRNLVWTVIGAAILALFLHFPARMGISQTLRSRPGDLFGRAGRQPPTNLWRIQIDIPDKEASKLRRYHWQGNGSEGSRPQALATVREGDAVFTNVTVHLKGAAGSFRPFDDQPCLTLNFEKQAPGQKFHGFTKLSLNNSVQDPTYLSELICRELFLAAGVPATRSGHATVVLNGRDLGLYVYAEGFGKGFLKRHFANVKGNLYDGGFVQEIHPNLQVNSGDNPNDRSDLRRLLSAARDRVPARQWASLGQILDIDRFITFLAMEIITCDWDGYAMNRNNTRIFHDLDSDKMFFIPHGMDQMFGTFRSTPQSPILPNMQGLVAQAVMSHPEARRLYLERMAELRARVLNPEQITNRIHELARMIRPTLAWYDSGLASSHDRAVEDFCWRVSARADSVTEQLSGPPPLLEFDAARTARLSNWKPERKGNRDSNATVKFIRDEAAGFLNIRIDGTATASWRTRVVLPAGRYRFEGKARVGAGTRGATAGLRISGAQAVSQPVGPDAWTPLRFPIRLDEQREVQLVCEFRAARGEISFDPGTLVLVRE